MNKPIPKFKTEAQERRFWRTHDSAAYINWTDAEEIRLPKLRPSTRSISLRLPAAMVEELKLLANKRDVPYQSLLKVFLSERIAAEFQTANPLEARAVNEGKATYTTAQVKKKLGLK